MPSAKDWRTLKSPGIEKQTELEIEGEKSGRMIHFQRFGKRGQLQGIPENAGIPGLVTKLMLCLFLQRSALLTTERCSSSAAGDRLHCVSAMPANKNKCAHRTAVTLQTFLPC